ncbi:hypothetical protein [Enterobacter oligotrophicus]|uniref:hypothetical protein n=1 Tax=Enterobacter oligotrophicus TaxID=2478464 RepID=UPI0023F0FCAD|nr:hypothetical protein [Enterobacter oligotrophicus]
MIELAIKTSLEQITGMTVYPLLLPATAQEGITFQRISDPQVGTGLARTRLTAGRFQISMYLVNNYTRLVELDAAIWSAWQGVVQGELAGYPVQYITRGGIQQGQNVLTNNSVQFRLVRDFTLTYPE